MACVLRLWPKNVPISGVITEASSVTPARLRVCSGSYGGSVFAIIRGATTDQVKHCKHCTMTAHCNRESDPQRKPGMLPDREPAHATRGSDGIIIRPHVRARARVIGRLGMQQCSPQHRSPLQLKVPQTLHVETTGKPYTGRVLRYN